MSIHHHIDDSIGILTVDAPPVNAIGAGVRHALDIGLRQMIADPRIEAVILICDGRTFFAGADIAEFGSEIAPPTMQTLLDVIDGATKPVIAAIHGTALGGGLELAMACHHRIAVPSAQMGLPEVHLGLLPGAGGTQRLPRIVGPEMALDLTVSGRRIDAGEALDIGLIDLLATEGGLREDAIAFARRIVAERRPLARVRDRQDKIEAARGKPDIFSAFRARHATVFRRFKAPDAIVRAIEAAVALPFDEGIAREAELLGELLPSRESEAQRHAFFAERRTSKIPGIAPDLSPRPIGTIGIIAMDETEQDIATACHDAGLSVIVAHAAQALAPADIIMVLLASAPSLDDLAAAVRHPDRLIGFHAPPENGRLLEIVRGNATAPDILLSAMKLARRIGRVPVLNGHAALPIAGRLTARLRHAAEALARDGIAPAAIDRALHDFGFAEGLFGPVDTSLPAGDGDAILARLLLPVAEEGLRLIDQGVVLQPSDIDMVAIHGCGWPVISGGPIFWAEKAAQADLHNRDVCPATLDAEAGHHLCDLQFRQALPGTASGSA